MAGPYQLARLRSAARVGHASTPGAGVAPGCTAAVARGLQAALDAAALSRSGAERCMGSPAAAQPASGCVRASPEKWMLQMLAVEDLGNLHSAASLPEWSRLAAALHPIWTQSHGALHQSLQPVVAWGLAGAQPSCLWVRQGCHWPLAHPQVEAEEEAPHLVGAAGLLALVAEEVVLSRQGGRRLKRSQFAVPVQAVCKKYSSGLEQYCLYRLVTIHVNRQLDITVRYLPSQAVPLLANKEVLTQG